MNSDNSRVCLFCCRSFAFGDRAEHAAKISKLSEDIKNYRSNEGLRELEECQKIIKCQQQRIRITLENSNVSIWDEVFVRPVVDQLNGKEKEDSTNFVVKFRHWIIQDVMQYKDRKLEGSLSISPTEEKRSISVKVEAEPELGEDDDHYFDSNSTWEPNQELVIKPDPHEITNDKRRKPRIKFEKKNTISSMTLRKRNITKPTNQIQSNIFPPKKLCLIKTQNDIKPCLKKSAKKILKKSPTKPASKSSKKLTSTNVANVKGACHFCELCPFKTKILLGFEQHLKQHECPQTDNLFKCPQCPSEFSTNQYLKFHHKLHQETYKMYCDICSEFLPVLSLQDHIKSHFPPNPDHTTIIAPQIIFCKNCSFCCTTIDAYLNHCRRHYVSDTAKFPCSICSEEFNTSTKLIHHYPQAHKDTVETWPCHVGKCSRIFPSKDTLIDHKRLIHRINFRVVPCADPNCDKMFSSVESMESHLGIHSGEKLFVCELCGEKYFQKDGLNSHRRRVHGAAKPKCKICGVEFFSPITLKAHVALHENRGVSCEICGKTFGSKQAVKDHLWTHSEEKRWTCDMCGKGFKTSDGWKQHKAMHEDRKNWNCEYCGKGFVRKSNLRDHLRVHTGERPYICDVCGKDFNQASALRVHKRKQHQ